MRKSALILILIFVTFAGFANEFKGTVYLDENRNGCFDSEEKGISGVVVSNGIDCVLTDEIGYYRLPERTESVLFITKPSDYMTPVNEYNIPQFYYIHYPEGSPEKIKMGINPTGDLPEEINFPLYAEVSEEDFEIVAVGDPQTKTIEEIDYLRDDIFADFVNTDRTFAIVLGDIMDNNVELFPDYLEVCKTANFPIYNVPGNHDLNFNAVDDKHSLDTFISFFGPSYYSFDYGKIHFVVLDDVEYKGSSFIGNVGETQLQWLEHDLEYVPEDKMIVLSMHVPIYSFVDNPGSKDHMKDMKELFKVLEGREKILALAGHTHTLENDFIGEKLGWTGKKPIHLIIGGAACGSWWGGPFDERGIPEALQTDGAPNGVNYLSFKGTEYTHLYKSANFEEDFQIRISTPRGNIKQKALKFTDIMANVFNAGDDTEVFVSLDGADFEKMTSKNLYDPYVQAVYKKNLAYGTARLCAHLYSASLPDNLELGLHTISVKYTDRYGRTFTECEIFKVY
ncbi:MAG TPA: calcineurin-like phosphoesterase family protein [Thermotogota bacterium]|nr:calcineurin-like phosphoesterase family protein [Thermotogota bacterium]HPJ87495.1 calcineurin-like phosphoesterase family protein [Thermotogota bacterium]HPR94700.1 calcineurin-like phosphoesterase family protein [Thermotogota bacterium]